MTETMGQEMSWSRNFIYITRMIFEKKKQINEKGNLSLDIYSLFR